MTVGLAAGSGDYNGDGISDLLFKSNYTGPYQNLLSFFGLTIMPSDPSREYVTSARSVGGSGMDPSAFGSHLLAFGDFNGDGIGDLLLDVGGNKLQIDTLHNSAMLGVYVTEAWSVANNGYSIVAGVGDFNGDGNSDVIMESMQDRYYQAFAFTQDGQGLLQLVTNGSGGIYAPAAGWIYKGSGDFDGNGKDDMLFQNVDGHYAIWELGRSADPNAFYYVITGGGTILNVPDPGWFYAGTGDFNGDGKSDILFQNALGQVAFWTMDGIAVIGGGTLGGGGVGGLVRGIGDYDNDGKPDILFLNGNGSPQFWTVDGTNFTSMRELSNTLDQSGNLPPGALLTGQTGQDFATLAFQRDDGLIGTWQMDIAQIAGGGTIGIAAAGWHAEASGNFMGTGETDIVYVNDDGRVAMLRTDGTHLIGGGTIGTMAAGQHYAGVGDINGDGVADIVFQSDNGDVDAWRMAQFSLDRSDVHIGNAAGFNVAAVADFTGDGVADLLLHRDGTVSPINELWVNVNGTFQEVTSPGDGLNDPREFPGPVPGTTLLGTGDFDGDGHADMLLFDGHRLIIATIGPSAAGGNYWYSETVADVHTPSVGLFGTLAKIVDLNHDQRDDLVFVDSAGTYHAWFMDGVQVIQNNTIADPGAGWHLI